MAEQKMKEAQTNPLATPNSHEIELKHLDEVAEAGSDSSGEVSISLSDSLSLNEKNFKDLTPDD
jgi:hypothetical protein